MAFILGLFAGGIPAISYASSLQEANDKLEAVSNSIGQMIDAVGNLDSEVDRFASENWRVVVPDVVSARDELVSAFDDLSGAVR